MQAMMYQVGDIENKLLDMVFGDATPVMHLFFTFVQSESDSSHVFGHYNIVTPTQAMRDVKAPLLLSASDARWNINV